MVNNIYNLYPQFTKLTDRRKQTVTVPFERRSGNERRQPDRTVLDTKLQQDLDGIKRIYSPFIKDIDRFEKAISQNNKQDQKDDLTIGALSSIPYIRRFSGVKDAIQQRDTIKAIGKAGLLIMNSPEDTRDIDKAFNEARMFLTKGKFTPDNAQTPFSFFRGTILEKPLKLMYESNNETLKELSNTIYRWDITLFNFKCVKKFLKKIGLNRVKSNPTQRKSFKGEVINEIELIGSRFSKFLGRMALRIPVIGVVFMFALEIPAIGKAFFEKDNLKDNFKNGIKQTLKSLINVSSTVLGGALLGTALAKSKVGSLVGIGIGSFLGSKAGKSINEFIDKA